MVTHARSGDAKLFLLTGSLPPNGLMAGCSSEVSLQEIEHRADGRLAIRSALTDGMSEERLQARQIGDLCADVLQMSGRNGPDFLARPTLRLGEVQQGADFFDGEAEFASAPDKREAAAMRGLVKAVTASRPPWFWHEANPLVISDGLKVHAGGGGEPADRQITGRGHR